MAWCRPPFEQPVMVCAFGAAPAPEFAQQVPVLIAQPAPMMAWGPEAMFPPVGMPGSGYPQFCQPFVDGAAFPESPGNFMPGPGFGLMAEPAPGDWPESPMKVSPPEGLQSAVAAATAASNACGSACVPVAVRQVASGMWCVLVSDPNAQRDQSFTQQTGLMDMNGAESAMHLNLAEHLAVAEPSYAAGPVQLYGGTGPQQLSPRESDKRGEPPATPPPTGSSGGSASNPFPCQLPHAALGGQAEARAVATPGAGLSGPMRPGAAGTGPDPGLGASDSSGQGCTQAQAGLGAPCGRAGAPLEPAGIPGSPQELEEAPQAFSGGSGGGCSAGAPVQHGMACD
ncbi:unnamed protein product [Effrenium voratum]|nr:unnamed protein product [Effrenium voratum]